MEVRLTNSAKLKYCVALKEMLPPRRIDFLTADSYNFQHCLFEGVQIAIMSNCLTRLFEGELNYIGLRFLSVYIDFLTADV